MTEKRLTHASSGPEAALESLRVLAAAAVVCVHVAATALLAASDAVSWWSANLWDSFAHGCVPVFVMLSGALLLGRREPASHFWRKRAARLVWPLVGWSLIYLGLQAWQAAHWSLPGLLALLVRGTPYYHLWYLWMLPGLYLATPALRLCVARCSRRQLWWLCAGLSVLAALEVPLGWSKQFFLSSSLAYLGCYLLGWLLFTQPTQPPVRWLWAGFLLAGAGVAVGAGLLLPLLGAQAIEWMYAYPNPLVLGMGACAFMLGLRLLPGKAWAGWLAQFAPLSFGIYLVHPLCLLGLSKAGLTALHWHPALGIPLLSGLVLLLSAAGVALLARLPGMWRLVR
ncbi:acyltransferase [Uliginosibacterium sp. 31-12]|uniref:acyltransferase n=1 Tax=Uliginosibacterium sp. 31-12 TaxID=3062781 RepID=UPI0026E2A601|nr:acyltransferase family protein [Uliginosibacterium sp. 31-12]MDO6386361.1 acyltransferase family protein [Uliginosibacterium sp. 31-12]